MKIYEQKLKSVLSDVVCDVCGRSCKKEQSIESGTLDGEWGYYSHKDGQWICCDMCEACFDKVLAFIESLGGKPQCQQY